jgi:hypothetical protein
VRHLGQIDRLGLPGHVAPEGKREGGTRRLEVDLLQDAAEGHDVEVLVRDLDANRALARDRRLDPQRAGGQGHRQVVGEALDPAHLDVRRGLDLVLGHHGAGIAADDLGRDPEAGQLLDDDLLIALVGGPVAASADREGDVIEGRDGRQDVLDPLPGRR